MPAVGHAMAVRAPVVLSETRWLGKRIGLRSRGWQRAGDGQADGIARSVRAAVAWVVREMRVR